MFGFSLPKLILLALIIIGVAKTARIRTEAGAVTTDLALIPRRAARMLRRNENGTKSPADGARTEQRHLLSTIDLEAAELLG